MIQLEPTEGANYFVLAKMYEDAGRYEEAEATLNKAKEMRPNDPAVYMQLAGYYNRQGDFEKTIEALNQRTEKEPNNPEAYYTLSTFYWEKAFRDFRITEAEKRDYVMKGIGSVNKACVDWPACSSYSYGVVLCFVPHSSCANLRPVAAIFFWQIVTTAMLRCD